LYYCTLSSAWEKREKAPSFLSKNKGDQQSDYSVYPGVGVVVCFPTAILIDWRRLRYTYFSLNERTVYQVKKWH
jgi:hypothetical protein